MKRNFILILAGLAVLAMDQKLLADSLYPAEGTSSIYNEKRARRVGDVITVIIQEDTQASQAASSQQQKASGLAIGAGTGFLGAGVYGFNVLNNTTNQIGVGASSAHQGQGTSSRSTTITGQMTAKIVSVLPGGNYMIEGSRYVEVNEEKQTIEVTGEIRPDDITSDNTISSLRVANAKIKLTGTGPASESAKPGLLTRVLGWLGLF
ncbi:MAG TPA: flagellar basal body L-ring protein FlgH [bacterium]|nr:flagellar basal body L-ring protein FlgH [bacterium]